MKILSSFRLELVDEFTKIVLSARKPFIYIYVRERGTMWAEVIR